MSKFFLLIIFLSIPVCSFADRYGIYGDYSGGGTSIFDILCAIVAIIFSFWFLSSSYEEWKKRKESGEKIERSDFVADIIIPFFGYIFVAFLLSVPFVLTVKFFGGVSAVKEYWLYIGLICFAVVAFLRQT